MNTQEVILFVFDTKEHHEANLQFLGENLFQDIIQVHSLNDFKTELDRIKNNPFQKFVFLVHIFYTEKLRGIKEFIFSKIGSEFKLREIYISDGVKNQIKTEMIEDELPQIANRIYKYHQVFQLIEKDDECIMTMDELLNGLKSKKGIFLSHSSKDSVIVNLFKENFLELGLKVDSKNIKFTSSEVDGIPAGVNIPDDLKSFMINEMGLFIQFVSKNYLESRTCLNEEGAAWCLLNEINFIPIYLDDSKRSFIKESIKAIEINNKESLLNIYENRKDFFMTDINIANLNKQVTKITDNYKSK